MAANFVLVGIATDGPSNVPTKPKNERELRALFGGDYTERFYITSSATSVVMQFTPWTLPQNTFDTKKRYLFAPYMNPDSKNVIQFGEVGGSGTHTLDMNYTPYLGKEDLILAATRFASITGEMPYVVRLGGTKATLTIEGWDFESKYAGGKYNYLGLASNGSAMTIFGLEPNYASKTYTYTTSDAVKGSIERDFDIGTSPVICTIAGTSMISSGLYWFGSGTNGSFSDDDLSYFLTNFTFPIKTNHVLILNEISSGMVENIYSHLIEQETQPRMFFIPSITYFGTGSANEYLSYMNAAVPYRHNMIASFVGDIDVVYQGEQVTRFAAEGAAIAYAKSGGFNLTNLPVEAVSFTPVLNAENLGLLKSGGFIPLMRYIGNDISVFEGTTTYGENSFLYSSKVAEISSIAYDYCFQFLGTVMQDGPKPEIALELMNRLANVSFVDIQFVDIIKEGEEMFVRIEGILPNEILSISFTIQN